MSITTSRKRLLSTRTLVASSLLTAISIILTRLFAVMVPLAGLPALRLSFGQIPLAITGILFGPLAGGIAGAVADLAGVMINPHGAFFPGFTLSSILWGVLPGLIYKIINKGKIRINFNIINAFVIVLLGIGLGKLIFTGGIFAVENGSLIVKGETNEVILSVLAIIVVIIFVTIPFIISRKYENKGSVYNPYSIDKIVFTVTIPYVIIALGLNTLWLSIMFKKGFMIFLPGRILAGVFVIPIFSIIIFGLSRFFKMAKNSY